MSALLFLICTVAFPGFVVYGNIHVTCSHSERIYSLCDDLRLMNETQTRLNECENESRETKSHLDTLKKETQIRLDYIESQLRSALNNKESVQHMIALLQSFLERAEIQPKVNGSWSGWSNWMPCSVSCGGGSQSATRTCTNPTPAFGGSSCSGNSSRSRSCNTGGCPVNGGWSAWSSSESCSASCGGGSRRATRTCTNPTPTNGGATCNGSSSQSQPCNTVGCPVSGKDCSELYEGGVKQSGVYNITPSDGAGKMEVYCDMVTDGGGWTVFQSRQDGSIGFYRNWYEYKQGFGNLSTEFWLGNENIHRLTRQTTYELRVDLEDHDGVKKHAFYTAFSIGSETRKYKLSIGSYLGDAGESLNYHNRRAFSTMDNDNDKSRMNCAAARKGAWWYSNCHRSNLNGLYGDNSYGKGVTWDSFKGHRYSLKRTSMKIRPVGFSAF